MMSQLVHEPRAACFLKTK